MDVIGIIPAAGQGSRLQPFRYPKELFPIGYTPDATFNGETFRLRVVCEYSIESLATAGVTQAYVIIGDHKFEVVRFFSDGREHGIDLAYLHQRNVNGLPYAIDCAYSWVKERISALVLPDTIVEPCDSVARSLDCLFRSNADVVLGVYPTDHPEDLCPVYYDDHLHVIALYDKPLQNSIRNTWGTAVWRPRFTDFLHSYLQRNTVPQPRELTLAEVFLAAIDQGLRVDAVPFTDGKFWDIGKNSSLVKARQEFDKLRTNSVQSIA